MANEGLGWDPLLNMVHIPGGHDCILGGGHTQLMFHKFTRWLDVDG